MPGQPVYTAFEALRWINTVCAFGLCLVAFARMVQLSVRKYNQNRGACCRAVFDSQNQVLLLTMAGLVLLGTAMLDYGGLHGILNGLASGILWNASVDVLLLACARLVHVFVSIYAKFHPPSRHVANALVVLSLSFAVAFLVVVSINARVTSAVQPLVLIIGACFVVVVFVGISVYSLSVLREPSNAQIRRTASPAEVAAKANLRTLLRGMLAILAAGMVLAFWNWFTPNTTGHAAVVQVVSYALCFTVVELIGCVCILLMVGGWRKESQPTTTTTAAATGKVAPLNASLHVPMHTHTHIHTRASPRPGLSPRPAFVASSHVNVNENARTAQHDTSAAVNVSIDTAALDVHAIGKHAAMAERHGDETRVLVLAGDRDGS